MSDTTLDELETERRTPGRDDLDTRSVRELVDLMNAEDARVPEAVAAAADPLAAAIEAIVERLRGDGRLIYVGAGTPGRLAALDAAECGPTFGLEPGVVVAVMAGGEDALARAKESGEDDQGAAVAAMADLGVTERDAVVGISASGRTPFVIAAVDHARAAGALTIGISSNRDASLSQHVDHALEVTTGPELIAGSTRLKAGTAQKLLLNTISTVAMIALGRTFGDLMVDVRATNAKLRRRAERIVGAATGEPDDVVRSTLTACGGEAKTAIVALLAGVDPAAARTRLGVHGGRVRDALGGNDGS